MRGSSPLSLLFSLIVVTSAVEAHPVAFEGATQITGSYMGPMSSFEAYHTYNERVALGVNSSLLELPEGDRLLTGLQHNWLVKRWNLKNAQGNLYAGAGGGYGWIKENGSSGSLYGRAAIQADFETLWIYTAVKSAFNIGADFTHAENTVSVGFAPYAHDYNRIATWFIVDFSYVSEMDDHVRIIPKIRLFKSTWFIEAGISLDGDPLISCMIHF